MVTLFSWQDGSPLGTHATLVGFTIGTVMVGRFVRLNGSVVWVAVMVMDRVGLGVRVLVGVAVLVAVAVQVGVKVLVDVVVREKVGKSVAVDVNVEDGAAVSVAVGVTF
jgi:hypothetical protein